MIERAASLADKMQTARGFAPAPEGTRTDAKHAGGLSWSHSVIEERAPRRGSGRVEGKRHLQRYVLALNVAFANFLFAPPQEQHWPATFEVDTRVHAA